MNLKQAQRGKKVYESGKFKIDCLTILHFTTWRYTQYNYCTKQVSFMSAV